MTFADRADAGRQLAALLGAGRGDPGGTAPPVVFGMARGGVAVAAEVADALGAPLEVVVVRKLGHPHQPELGMGAIGEDGVRLVNSALVGKLGVPRHIVVAAAKREERVLEQRLRAYRGDRPPVPTEAREAIVVDDGMATGFTARAAIEVMRRRHAARVVLGVPVAPPNAVEGMRQFADDVVCVEISDDFIGISQCYRDFHQVSDEEVAALLAARAPRRASGAGAGGAETGGAGGDAGAAGEDDDGTAR